MYHRWAYRRTAHSSLTRVEYSSLYRHHTIHYIRAASTSTKKGRSPDTIPEVVAAVVVIGLGEGDAQRVADLVCDRGEAAEGRSTSDLLLSPEVEALFAHVLLVVAASFLFIIC